MRIRETDAYGSFNAWGIGLSYEYDSHTQKLSIIHARRYKPILDIDMSLQAAEKPMDFIKFLDKATQIHALMLSNNRTIDVTEILGIRKLSSYIENTLVTATMALLLSLQEYANFEEIFCDRYNFRALKISCTKSWSPDNRLFNVELETFKGNKIAGQAFYLYSALFSLSKTTVSDLMIMEMNNNLHANEQMHALLTASSKLSTLSLILNEGFEPRRRITRTPEKEIQNNRLRKA